MGQSKIVQHGIAGVLNESYDIVGVKGEQITMEPGVNLASGGQTDRQGYLWSN